MVQNCNTSTLFIHIIKEPIFLLCTADKTGGKLHFKLNVLGYDLQWDFVVWFLKFYTRYGRQYAVSRNIPKRHTKLLGARARARKGGNAVRQISRIPNSELASKCINIQCSRVGYLKEYLNFHKSSICRIVHLHNGVACWPYHRRSCSYLALRGMNTISCYGAAFTGPGWMG